MKKVILVLLVLCTACNLDDSTSDPVLCTEDLRPGLEITVKSLSDTFSIEGVTVVATEGLYTETLQHLVDSQTFVGAYERTGTYRITVTKQGFQAYTSDPITVQADACHVITETREVELQPN
ncbi:hypothetical protein [Aquimarina sp. 2201CG5-10]|uniref:hypothetical protein n=1 Tax=Aquimarina callyspongiae TaxID=3098150 RepID=UPI002AB5C613|nr:hypothetical protein [Aquimarina sp. 2201CG5-10]MDY8138743.1 hypothetical protein [Aquimarina sp. 2201CG5-10]